MFVGRVLKLLRTHVISWLKFRLCGSGKHFQIQFILKNGILTLVLGHENPSVLSDNGKKMPVAHIYRLKPIAYR